jgi:hypothetical protein
MDWGSRYRTASQPAPGGLIAKDLVVTGTLDGMYEVTNPGTGWIPYYDGAIHIDPPGSRDIRIAIDPAVGVTYYAGLFFSMPCMVDVETDGTIVARQEGIGARSQDGRLWVSVGLARPGGGRAAAFVPATSR